MEQRGPFPGMDPWLEEQWGDVHHRIVQYGCDQIAQRLPDGLFAAVEETVYVVGYDTEPLRRWRARPDAGVFETPTGAGGRRGEAEASATSLAEPVRLRIIEQRVVEGHIEIRRIGGDEPLVTAIEVVSRTNKIDRRGRLAYVEKRESFYDAGVNVVEIDLLREGEPLIDVPWDRLAPELITPYKACVRRAPPAESEVEYFPLRLRERLPRIGIPLRPEDADVPLDLQAPIDEAYRIGRYAGRLDYGRPPRPAPSADDAAWAAELVAAARG
jgi:hypothetical protein